MTKCVLQDLTSQLKPSSQLLHCHFYGYRLEVEERAQPNAKLVLAELLRTVLANENLPPIERIELREKLVLVHFTGCATKVYEVCWE